MNLLKNPGYSGAHIVIWKPEIKEKLMDTLKKLGCDVNSQVGDNYLVISIQPQVSYQLIRAFLLNQKSNENIDFRDCLSKIHAATV